MIADSVIPTCPVIIADNVSAYVGRFRTEVAKTFAEGVAKLDLSRIVPQAAPPFERFWVEFRWPYATGTGATAKRQFCWAFDVRARQRKVAIDGIERNVGWRLDAHVWADYDKKGPVSYPFHAEVDVGESGELLGWKNTRDDGSELGITVIPPEATLILLMTIGFMHCKNVTLREQKRPDKLIRSRKKKNKKSLLRWHVLDIEPMRQVLQTEGNADAVGIEQALHICRGHFKDYRQSGLFGKVKGVFWWDAIVRGASPQGVIAKDYNVKAPR
jgi:hypothetical protein